MTSRGRKLLIVSLLLVGFVSLMLRQVWALQPSTFTPFEITAMHVVGMATRQAHFTPTYTPITPTLTPRPTQDYPAFSAYYRQILAQTAGFDHPVFDEVVESLVEQLRVWEVEEGLRLTGARFQPEIARVRLDSSEYVAMLAQDQMLEEANRLLLFRRDSDVIILLPIPPRSDPTGYVYSFTPWSWLEPADLEAYGFADRNGNGLPDIAIYTTTGGNHPLRATWMLEIQSDGSIAELMPD